MTLQVSTGFTSRILGPIAFETIFNGGAIAIYTGEQPEDANQAPTGTLLGYVSAGGAAWTPDSSLNGLSFVRAGQWAGKNPAQAWAITPAAAGTAGWFRLLTPGDNGGASFDLPRIDGAISADGLNAELRLLNPVLQLGVAKSIDEFLYTIPPIAGA